MEILYFSNFLVIGIWLLIINLLVSYIHNVSYPKKLVKGFGGNR